VYDGRDLTELEGISPHMWTDEELAFFHHGMQQLSAYLNIQGNSRHKQILKEIERRGGLQKVDQTFS
jgi:hypothetical protein